jgi:hypothetical protein
LCARSTLLGTTFDLQYSKEETLLCRLEMSSTDDRRSYLVWCFTLLAAGMQSLILANALKVIHSNICAEHEGCRRFLMFDF